MTFYFQNNLNFTVVDVNMDHISAILCVVLMVVVVSMHRAMKSVILRDDSSPHAQTKNEIQTTLDQRQQQNVK